MSNFISDISAEFPYESKYIDINGSAMHYIEQGHGDPIVFLHGMVTSNYLWRNIIPALAPYGRCIAPDLIGMGKSDKPNIAYRIFEHIDYFEKFVKALNLRNITLVLHGWGSLVGFEYARLHENNVKALAFTEAYLRLTEFNAQTLPMQEIATLLKKPDHGYKAIVEENILMTKTLPGIILRKLSEQELQHYRSPYLTKESRKPLWQYMQDLPIPDGPEDVKQLINNCSEWLQKTQLPKLLLYAVPGFVTPISNVDWAHKNLSNLTSEDLGEAYHCPQETNPNAFCAALENWYIHLPRKSISFVRKISNWIKF